MANIERRRKKRKAVIISSAIGAVLLIGLIVSLVFALKNGIFAKKQDGIAAGETIESTPVPTADETSELPTQAPEITPVTQTSEPAGEPGETPAATHEPTAEPGEGSPKRVTEELSAAMLKLDCATRYDASGNAEVSVNGSFAILFINNTDRVLYSVEFNVGQLRVKSVDIDGASSGFSVYEGLLSIPLVNELGQNETAEIYIEFEAALKLDSEFILPNIAYDTPFILTADITSDTWLGIEGCKSQNSSSDSRQYYRIDEASVREVRLRLRY